MKSQRRSISEPKHPRLSPVARRATPPKSRRTLSLLARAADEARKAFLDEEEFTRKNILPTPQTNTDSEHPSKDTEEMQATQIDDDKNGKGEEEEEERNVSDNGDGSDSSSDIETESDKDNNNMKEEEEEEEENYMDDEEEEEEEEETKTRRRRYTEEDDELIMNWVKASKYDIRIQVFRALSKLTDHTARSLKRRYLKIRSNQQRQAVGALGRGSGGGGCGCDSNRATLVKLVVGRMMKAHSASLDEVIHALYVFNGDPRLADAYLRGEPSAAPWGSEDDKCVLGSVSDEQKRAFSEKWNVTQVLDRMKFLKS